ncbi:large-conductance mechanosensitive channel protein MscL [bacterium]|nr:large-conductance mechanosensitive channel protein MscL [bacterium]
MLKEFREFAMKGNVVDLAVGFILGGAFGTIVSSLVNDVIMPPVGLLMGGVDFSAIKYVMQPASIGADGAEVAEVAINIGMFINNVISFVIVAFAMFMIVKAMNSMKKKEEEAPAAPSPQETLLAEIRDLLAKQK